MSWKTQSEMELRLYEKAHSALIEWKPINDRTAYTRFKGMFLLAISVINVYAL